MTKEYRVLLDAICKKAEDAGVIFTRTQGGAAIVKDCESNIIVKDIEGFNSAWSKIQKELNEGAGEELTKNDKGVVKFCSVNSSCALCINNFLPIVTQLDKVNLFNLGHFTSYNVEKKLNTGLGGFPAHLDLFFTNDKTILGVESKYTEHFTPKLPDKDGNLTKYKEEFSKTELPESFISDVLTPYIEKKELYLDASQLIKHTIALLREAKKVNKKAVLVYIYWTAGNCEEGVKHKEEVKEFNSLISKYIDFIPLTYEEFWEQYKDTPALKEAIAKNIARYKL